MTIMSVVNYSIFSAQGQGLLCEESGSSGDNIKYCGYCDYHYRKLVRCFCAVLFLIVYGVNCDMVVVILRYTQYLEIGKCCFLSI